MSEIWNKYTTDWSYHEEQVMKFNALCGNDFKDNDLIIPLYYDLCKEEAEEALAATKLEDVKGNTISEGQALNDLVDAACDMFYVGYYLYSKINSSSAVVIKDMTEMLERLERLSSDTCRGGVTYITSINLLDLLRVDPTEALNKVHESNFSKFIDVTGIPLEDINEIAETEVEEIKQEYKAKGKDLKEVTYQVNPYGDEHWLTFYNENGKVLKPSTFFEPDFTDVIKHLL
jgi:hypothetical protein